MASVNYLIEEKLATAAKIVEDQIDAEMEQLEKMDSKELENLRRRRIEEMKKQSSKRQEWLTKGHGEFSEISNEKEFFNICKDSENVVCHFHRDSTFRCKIVDKHLSLLAKKHVEARFIKLSVDKAPFLVERLKIKVLPTIVLVKDAKTKDYIVGFDDLGGHDEFSTEMLEWRIAKSGVIDYSGDLLVPPQESRNKSKTNLLHKPKKTIRERDDSSDDDDD
ncbi:Thioredoxin domain-containing protein 9 [Chamberlinius hualienensis]